MPASNFTYPRPVVDDIARCIRSVRVTNTWTDAQRITLDMLIDMICIDLEDNHEGFDPERFKTRAGYYLGRLNPERQDKHG